jgi:hypothetical protein
MPHPDMSPNLHLVGIRHSIELNSGCCGCRWHLKLKDLNLLLKSDNHRYPLLNLKVLLLVGALIQPLVRRVKLLTDVVPHVLGLTEAMIHDLQLLVLV